MQPARPTVRTISTHAGPARHRLSRRWLAAGLLAASVAAGAAEPQKAVLDAAAARKEESIALLQRLVNMDSGTLDIQGVEQVRQVVTAELQKLGGRVETVPEDGRGTHLVATFAGQGTRKILILAHMDTVFAPGSAAARPFRIERDRAYGPGVMDDKGGIVVGLMALKVLQQVGFKDHGQITFLFDSGEEVGSAATSAFIRRVARPHDVALNLEPGRPADGIVLWRKGGANAVVEVQGRAAHAGVEPEAGRNAALELAFQVLQLTKVADAGKGTTVNFTVLDANGPTNVIRAAATAKADVRVLVPEELDRVERDMARVAQTKLIPDTVVKTRLDRGLPPMPQTAAGEKLVQTAQSIYGELGKKLTIEGSGGAADASLVAAEGVPILDGFGIVGGGIHTPEEYAEVSSITPRVYLLARMLMEISKP